MAAKRKPKRKPKPADLGGTCAFADSYPKVDPNNTTHILALGTYSVSEGDEALDVFVSARDTTAPFDRQSKDAQLDSTTGTWGGSQTDSTVPLDLGACLGGHTYRVVALLTVVDPITGKQLTVPSATVNVTIP